MRARSSEHLTIFRFEESVSNYEEIISICIFLKRRKRKGEQKFFLLVLVLPIGGASKGQRTGAATRAHRDGAHGCGEIEVPPLWDSVELAPTGERQSPIYIWWRDSTYDPALKPLTISYDPTTCLHVWNNGYFFLVEFEDSADKSVTASYFLHILHCYFLHPFAK
ncbi:Carbonic Anhydrase 5B [Manis pentadactyla]|nr:Carbonic Anhydrase 5B [Manis pentadactyla]